MENELCEVCEDQMQPGQPTGEYILKGRQVAAHDECGQELKLQPAPGTADQVAVALDKFAAAFAGDGDIAEDIAHRLTCSELDALTKVWEVAGYRNLAAFWQAAHIENNEGDEDCSDRHRSVDPSTAKPVPPEYEVTMFHNGDALAVEKFADLDEAKFYGRSMCYRYPRGTQAVIEAEVEGLGRRWIGASETAWDAETSTGTHRFRWTERVVQEV